MIPGWLFSNSYPSNEIRAYEIEQEYLYAVQDPEPLHSNLSNMIFNQVSLKQVCHRAGGIAAQMILLESESNYGFPIDIIQFDR